MLVTAVAGSRNQNEARYLKEIAGFVFLARVLKKQNSSN